MSLEIPLNELTPRQIYRKNWVQNNREQVTAYNRNWRKTNPDKVRLNARNSRQREKDKAFEILGGYICSRCGFNDARALQIDHVNGDGYKEKRFRGQIYRTVTRANGEGFQVLCANCNWIKRDENGEHMHVS